MTRVYVVIVWSMLGLVQAQNPSSLNISQPPISGPAIVGGLVVGAVGGESIYYWVSARTPGGTTSPVMAQVNNTVGAANLSVSNYVTVSWSAVSGATGYDVLRSSTQIYPVPASGTCTCAVVLNTASTSVNDQGGALSAYPFVGAVPSVPVQAFITIDNLTTANPFVNLQLLSPRYNVTAPIGSGSGGDTEYYNNGVLVGTRPKVNFVPDTNNTWVLTDDAGNDWVSVQAVPVITNVIQRPTGACNSGPTATGGSWSFNTGVTQSCTGISGAISPAQVTRIVFTAAGNQTSTVFQYPASAGTTITFRGKFTQSTAITPTMQATIGCLATNTDYNAGPTSPAETAPVSLVFSNSWTTSFVNEGTVSFTNASLTANKMCFLTLERTDGGGGSLSMWDARLEFN